MSEPQKTIVINPEFLKLPMRGGRTKKNHRENGEVSKPIKIRSENTGLDKTYKRRALNYIRKQQEEKYKRLMKGTESDESSGHRVEITDPAKTYADEFKSSFDDSLAFLQKLADQNTQKTQVHNATLRHHTTTPVVPNSTLFQTPILNNILDNNIPISSESTLQNVLPINLPKPTYGCLKGGTLPTYRTLKAQNNLPITPAVSTIDFTHKDDSLGQNTVNISTAGNISRLTPEQQRAELKQFLEKRKEEKLRIERVKRQQHIMKPGKKQKRTTTRTFRVGKSKHYAHVGVLIPNKTIRTEILTKKQKIRETPLEDMRKYLIKKGLIRVGSSCPNDVLRQMYESSMMICGEIQNHNPDNLLYNYLHNGL